MFKRLGTGCPGFEAIHWDMKLLKQSQFKWMGNPKDSAPSLRIGHMGDCAGKKHGEAQDQAWALRYVHLARRWYREELSVVSGTRLQPLSAPLLGVDGRHLMPKLVCLRIHAPRIRFVPPL